MHRYQLPYRGASGIIAADDQDHIELMLDAVGRHQNLHILTYLRNGWILNRYEVGEQAEYYILHTGNNDPTIEFSSEWSDDDFTEEQHRKSEEMLEEFRTQPWTPEQIAAVSWAIDHLKKRVN